MSKTWSVEFSMEMVAIFSHMDVDTEAGLCLVHRGFGSSHIIPSEYSESFFLSNIFI